MVKLDLKLSTHNSELIFRESEIMGVSVHDFIISATLDKAYQAMDQRGAISHASPDDVDVLIKVLTDPPEIPDRILKKMIMMKHSGGPHKLERAKADAEDNKTKN